MIPGTGGHEDCGAAPLCLRGNFHSSCPKSTFLAGTPCSQHSPFPAKLKSFRMGSAATLEWFLQTMELWRLEKISKIIKFKVLCDTQTPETSLTSQNVQSWRGLTRTIMAQHMTTLKIPLTLKFNT